MIAAIELHNKPLFPYRYEVCTLLVVNAWELMLKAYIYKYLKKVRVINKDGTTKPFLECVACVASNSPKEFQSVKESLESLYKYRNEVAHYHVSGLDPILFSLLKANVVFYVGFLGRHFHIDLAAETNLILLPIGFAKPYSPIDFLSDSTTVLSKAPEAVRKFLQGIVESSERLESQGIEESILFEFRMAIENEKRVKNADIIAGINNAKPTGINITVSQSLRTARITDDPDAKAIRISEEELYKTVFTETYQDVVNGARVRFSDFKQNRKFNAIMKELKTDHELCRPRLLDPHNPKSARKDFYSKQIYEELTKHYQANSES